MPRIGFRFLRTLVFTGAIAATASCSDSGTTETFKLGSVTVKTVAASNGAAVGLIRVDLLRAVDKSIWRTGRTDGSTGSLTFGADEGGVVEGSYVVRLVSDGVITLAAGESNDRPVTVTQGSSATITFKTSGFSAPSPGG